MLLYSKILIVGFEILQVVQELLLTLLELVWSFVIHISTNCIRMSVSGLTKYIVKQRSIKIKSSTMELRTRLFLIHSAYTTVAKTSVYPTCLANVQPMVNRDNCLQQNGKSKPDCEI